MCKIFKIHLLCFRWRSAPMVEVKVVEQVSKEQRPKGRSSTESGVNTFLSFEVSINVLK